MADWAALILVAWVLYLIECLAWIGRDACACYRHPVTGRWQTTAGSRLPGNDRGGLMLVSPASLSGGLVTSSLWPVSIDPDGIASAPPAGDATTDPRYIRFDEIETVDTRLGDLRINGKPFARVSREAFAEYLVDQVRTLRRSTRGNRASKIRAAMADSLSPEHVMAAWAAFRRRTRLLTMLCRTHLAIAFFVSPLTLVLAGPQACWPYLLAAVMVLTAAIAVLYFWVHSALYPSCRSDRWVHAVSMVLLPVAAMRCADKLSRDALCAYSPFAIAPALCGIEAARPALREAWIDLARAGEGGGSTSAAGRCLEWFRALLKQETQAALDRAGAALLAPPVVEDASMLFYCPRCHAQFGDRGANYCSECPDVQLVRFASG